MSQGTGEPAQHLVQTEAFPSRRPSHQHGTIHWFNKERGYGAIRSERGVEVYVCLRDVQPGGPARLLAGQHVEFALTRAHGRLEARDVKLLG